MRKKNSRFPYLHIERNSGKTYYYVRMRSKGSRIRLKYEFGTKEFFNEYSDAIKSLNIASPNINSTNPQSLRWLVSQYMVSSAFTHNIANSTRIMRSRLLGHIVQQSGDFPYRSITKANLEAAKELRKNTPNAANNYIKACRGLFNWACEQGYLEKNPTEGLKKYRIKSDGFPTWTDEEVAHYQKSYPYGTRERLLFELYRNTGFRRSDVSVLGPQHIKNGVINIQCQKNKTKVSIPITEELQKAIEALPKEHLAFMCDKNGKPFKPETLSNYLRKWCRAIGIKKSAHGLRKYLTTEFADSGASDRELMAWFGWKTSRQVEVYIRNANHKRMADRALKRLKEEEQKGGSFALENETFALEKNKAK